MPAFRTLDGVDVKGKRVLVRVDFNVPMQNGEVTDATRIERAAVTIEELMRKGARVVILSHFGRPKGKVESSMSLAPIDKVLSQALGGVDVRFAPDCVGPLAHAVVDALPEGGVALLENLRFHAGEEKGDPAFADQLATLGDIYVNDAFSVSHRAHASVTGLAERLPSYAGRLMQAELEALQAVLGGADRPTAALIGGAKVSTKLDVLGNVLDKVDVLVIGGGMANTFLNAKGIDVGKSLCERDLADTAREIMAKAEAKKVEILLPVDAVVAKEFRAGAPCRTVALDAIEPDDMILDVGPASARAIAERLGTCRTMLWNGPLGAFEIEPFDRGTNEVARAAAALTKAGKLKTVAGGGDTVAALAHAGVLDDFTYVSTAGGAFLEWLEGKELPGVAALARHAA
ncbi:phosphoglycerate kinase [Benzoatithermus flavus]|uniref:Phosphoglycerate kinase n=1 Tax=Benzoatithermus flavus TaxID=3108223 RepID=A0ABU8XVB1_9PROT